MHIKPNNLVITLRTCRKLARLLSASTNPVVLAVACHDMGQYVKYNPIDGRK
jgi:V-type H+-transporting ATPase subunit H